MSEKTDRGTLVRRLQAEISTLHEENRSLQDRLRHVEEIDRLYLDFAFALSHELRTPLTLISGYAQKLLLRWTLTDEERRRDMVEKINVSSHRLSRLIDDMLLVTDVERGLLSIHIRRVDVAAIIEEAVSDLTDRTMGVLPSIEREGASVHVMADGFRLEQVLICLLENAVKHSQSDSTVHIHWHTESDNIVIDVGDQGPGIDPADISRLFTRFSRLERVLGQNQGGIGLGLYIARRLVEAMQGTISVMSAQGSGSTFRVSIPIAET